MRHAVPLLALLARGTFTRGIAILIAAAFLGTAFCAGAAEKSGSGKKKIVLIAGRASHGYFAHTHYAGCMLLAKSLNENVPGSRRS